MDGYGEHYTKRNESGNERQIPYDLTYKWILINKTNKQNRTETLKLRTVTRGEMGDDNGGRMGCQGTCIKDTWTKPKGDRIKGGRWGWLGWGGVVGDNGDNCT